MNATLTFVLSCPIEKMQPFLASKYGNSLKKILEKNERKNVSLSIVMGDFDDRTHTSDAMLLPGEGISYDNAL